VKKDEMGGACSTKRGEEECIYVIGGNSKGKKTTGKTKAWMGR
jgi:hypothetical protein